MCVFRTASQKGATVSVSNTNPQWAQYVLCETGTELLQCNSNVVFKRHLYAQPKTSELRSAHMFVTFNEKVKCTLVQALRLCTGRTAHRGSRDIALLFHDHGTRRGWGVSVTPRPLFTPGKDPVPIVQKAGWTPGPFWTGPENLAPTGIRSPDRPARSQSLYRMRYPAHN